MWSSAGVASLLAATAFLSLAAPTRADEESPHTGPRRHGLTLEVGLGAGHAITIEPASAECSMWGHCDGPGDREQRGAIGFVLPSFGVGVFVSSQVALLARVSNGPLVDGNLSSVYGFGWQLWPVDFLFLGAGAGLATWGRPFFLPIHNRTDEVMELGYGFYGRVGWNGVKYVHDAFGLALEFLPAFYLQRTVYNTVLVFQWQYY
jgi:hypothetical protein